ncbi:MAG: deaminase [Candidatus Buchananbacteria bacterium]|nr:deaminase [Candidatus Buchananbacteria bacterium]
MTPLLPDWDSWFMTMAYLIASKSKDQSTHIGAVVVGRQKKEIRSTGYNSFPRGINDNLAERQARPEKYFWFAHAEFNAVCNAALIGVSLNDCIMYTSGIPCMNCALAIIQSGIKTVTIDKFWDDQNPPEWQDHARRTKQLFTEAGVDLKFWEGELVPIVKFNRGEIIG